VQSSLCCGHQTQGIPRLRQTLPIDPNSRQTTFGGHPLIKRISLLHFAPQEVTSRHLFLLDVATCSINVHQVLKSNYQEQNTNRENGHLPVKLFTKLLQKRVAMQPPFRRELNRPLFASATRVCSASVAAPEFQGPGQVKVMDKNCNFFAGLKFNWSKTNLKVNEMQLPGDQKC